MPPYIDQPSREAISDSTVAETAGELNYVLTRVIIDYVRVHGLSYQIINDVLGALDGAAREFYRRVAAPYEDVKMHINGDVYGNLQTELPHTKGSE
jgi:hypothetical protein